jgi:hypothetical protein
MLSLSRFLDSCGLPAGLDFINTTQQMNQMEDGHGLTTPLISLTGDLVNLMIMETRIVIGIRAVSNVLS